jgi:diguanylate cyclase (GGDEF)-like protein
MPGGGDEISSDGRSVTAVLIDNEIARYSANWRSNRSARILKFCPPLERLFEADTRMTRARELQLTAVLGTGFFFSTSITDFVFVPDLELKGLVVRALLLPLIFTTILYFPKMPGLVREAAITLTGMVVLTVMSTITAISSAPLSAYAFATAVIGLIYGNTTLPLRFRDACLTSLICGGIMIAEIFAHPGVSSELRWVLAFQVVMGSTFSLITAYRIERSTRLNYLLSSREAVRLSMLAADREKLAALSNTDALTGLVNRRCFDSESAAIFVDRSNVGKEVALLFMDVDYFKNYNDHYGHPAGDSCLRAVATAISSAPRETKSLTARYGGEEFAILLLDVKRREAELIARRVCRAVSEQRLPHLYRDDRVKHVTISVGVASGKIGDHLTVDSLIETADNALYVAKREGRNRVEFRLPKAA